jgi:hypothetical protein
MHDCWNSINTGSADRWLTYEFFCSGCRQPWISLHGRLLYSCRVTTRPHAARYAIAQCLVTHSPLDTPSIGKSPFTSTTTHRPPPRRKKTTDADAGHMRKLRKNAARCHIPPISFGKLATHRVFPARCAGSDECSRTVEGGREENDKQAKVRVKLRRLARTVRGVSCVDWAAWMAAVMTYARQLTDIDTSPCGRPHAVSSCKQRGGGGRGRTWGPLALHVCRLNRQANRRPASNIVRSKFDFYRQTMKQRLPHHRSVTGPGTSSVDVTTSRTRRAYAPRTPLHSASAGCHRRRRLCPGSRTSLREMRSLF